MWNWQIDFGDIPHPVPQSIIIIPNLAAINNYVHFRTDSVWYFVLHHVLFICYYYLLNSDNDIWIICPHTWTRAQQCGAHSSTVNDSATIRANNSGAGGATELGCPSMAVIVELRWTCLALNYYNNDCSMGTNNKNETIQLLLNNLITTSRQIFVEWRHPRSHLPSITSTRTIRGVG